MTGVKDSEQIARLLFYPQMIKEDKLLPNVFPMNELLAKKGKNGLSVDRYDLLNDPSHLLYKKASKFANANKDRNLFGYCVGGIRQVRNITVYQSSAQALDVWPDAIKDNDPPDPWDNAHALLRKFDKSYTKAHLRGVRDKLIILFSKRIITF